MNKQLEQGLTPQALGKAIRIRDITITGITGNVQTFKQGTYNSQTGAASYTVVSLPAFVEKLNQLHKAGTKDPLFFLNIFFGVSLLFFLISS